MAASSQSRSTPAPSGSIFSQKLDRVAFIAYFLGAVVPLVALGIVVERFVLPTLEDNVEGFALIGLLVSLAALSLGSFFTLRRSTLQSLAKMDGDNHRLASLLEVASALATAQHGSDAAEAATRCALSLTAADAAYQIAPAEADGPPVLVAAAGEDASKLYQSHGRPIAEIAGLAMSEGSPVVRGGQRPPDRPAEGFSAAAVVPLRGDGESLGALAVTRRGAGARFEPAQVDALSTLAAFTSVALRNAELRDTQRNFFTYVTDMLVTALDSQLGYHRGHGNRVAQLANHLGRELGLDEAALQRLHFSALLHDVGLLKLDPAVQNNPRACQKHSVLGARMLGRIRLWQDLAPIVHAHHERWDGSGYPEGLKQEAIPIEARIIALCDAFDTITSNDSYRKPVGPDEALAEIERCAGTQFDPALTRLLREQFERGAIEVEGT